jgi:type IV pilus secretin PilQ/predicted competence protein
MRLQMPHMKLARRSAQLGIVTAVALAGGMAVAAGTGPIRLLGVSGEGNSVLIESAEPAAYVVKRPDPMTLVVELRNVSVANAANLVERRDAIAAVSIEQGSAPDGKALALVRVSLARPSEYAVRSSRNLIRLDLTAPQRSAVSPGVSSLAPAPAAPARATQLPAAQTPDATILESVLASAAAGATTVTLGGNGRLTPADVSESHDRPRRLVLDFPNVASKARAQTTVLGPLVTRVRVAVNSREPLVTRVVMEVADGATYHVERAGTDGRDLAVVFEPAQSATTVMLPAAAPRAARAEQEPDIPLAQAIANAASITPRETTPADPIAALRTAPLRTASPVPSPVPAPVAAAAPAPVPAAAAPLRQAPAPPPPPPAAQLISGPSERKYQGNPITLDFSGADLRSVLRYFNEISGLNIIIDPSVPSTPIDIVLRDVPWDQAFETLLRTHKLGYVAEGTIVRIAPIAVLADEEGERRKLSEAKALAGDLRVQTFSLSYAKAADMIQLLTKSALSQRGQIQFDARTNTVIMTDLPDRLTTAQALITNLDRPEPQVEIEARVITTSREFAHAIGVQWGLNGRMVPQLGNTTNLPFPNSGVVTGVVPNAPLGTVVGLPAQSGAIGAVNTAIGLALGSVNGSFNLDIALSALERSGKGRILSTPRVTTQNNVEAEITQGVQIPVTTPGTSTSPPTTTFKDASLTLRVTPQITSANTVIMSVSIENSTQGLPVGTLGNVSINTQRANTRVQVSDGMTTVMGGIFVSTENSATDRTPLLHRIPLLGWLFRRDSISDDSRELLIFITPRILREL